MLVEVDFEQLCPMKHSLPIDGTGGPGYGIPAEFATDMWPSRRVTSHMRNFALLKGSFLSK